MKRINAVVATHAMNNWDVLGQGVVVGDYEVYFHRDPRMSIQDGRVRFNFDVVVDDGSLMIDKMKLHHLVPPRRVHTIKRYNKVEQQMRLLALVELNNDEENGFLFKNFYPLTMHHNPQMNGFSQLINPERPVVIKPLDGARGIGQFLVDPAMIPLTVVVDVLDGLVRGRVEIDDVLPTLRKFDPTFEYATSGEREENEGLHAIKSQGFCIQDYVPKIKLEYRLLTGQDGEIAYCQRRDIRSKNNTGFAQATGSEANSAKGDDIVAIRDVLSGSDLQGLQEMARLVGPLSSIDLFITEDEKWGIFEYCNQFGMKGVPIQLAQTLHSEMILSLIKRAGL